MHSYGMAISIYRPEQDMDTFTLHFANRKQNACQMSYIMMTLFNCVMDSNYRPTVYRIIFFDVVCLFIYGISASS